MKRVMLPLLLLVALGGTATAIRDQLAPGSAPAASPAVLPAAQADGDIVLVTYFTTDVRCASCVRIEMLTRQSVEQGFAPLVAEGRVVFQTINVDRPENRHFIKDYKLVSKTVIVSDMHDGREQRWVNLQEVWFKLRDPAEFERYIASAVRDYLGSGA